MAIDLLTEKTLSVKAAARFAARLLGDDKPMHVATIYRWISPGIRGICLGHARIGGRMVTSQEAIQRFSQALTTPQEQADAPVTAPAPARRTRSLEERKRIAFEALRREGINV